MFMVQLNLSLCTGVCTECLIRQAVSTYVRSDKSLILLFENKSRWKQWMCDEGLSSAIPLTYNTSSHQDISYPAVLKFDSMHFGKGVKMINNDTELSAELQKVKRGFKILTYSVEEALTGMGQSELSAYGSVYNGELLSLRCVLYTYSSKGTAPAEETIDADKGGARGGKNSSSSPASISIIRNARAFKTFLTSSRLIPCGQDIVAIFRPMFLKTKKYKIGGYSGVFCGNLKSDSNGRLKVMEINARFCANHIYKGALFISSVVPLMFARHEDLLHSTTTSNSSSTTHDKFSIAKKQRQNRPYHSPYWYSENSSSSSSSNGYGDGRNVYSSRCGQVLRNILSTEKRVLKTGGTGKEGESAAEYTTFDINKRYKYMGYNHIKGFAGANRLPK
mmetsp:Transcript_10604/g.17848  ORF Transcript_10604/g.17848 Transcript_10604/m.17848 type:complete len:391 (-) Transcript_10604:373-1545(-)